MTRTTKNSQGLLSKDVSLDASYDESAIHEREEGAPTISETQLSNEEIVERRVKDLEEQLEMLQGENQSLESEIKAPTFTVERFKNNNEHFKEELFFLVLVRLRGGYRIEDMSIRFNMSPSNISRILITWYDFLHTQLRSLAIWATRQTVDETMPKCFQTIYPKTRVILDWTDIFIEVPSSYRSQSVTFSSYKHHNTVKGLVGIDPSGAVTFVSDLFTGRCLDKQIIRASGILDLLEKDDDVMADRGFEIEELLPEGVTLNIPPFLNDEPRLSLQDEWKTRKIASVRIHVERASSKHSKSYITFCP